MEPQMNDNKPAVAPSELKAGLGLLPCPCCGSKASFGAVISDLDNDPNDGGMFAACEECELSTKLVFPCGDDPHEMLSELWNARVMPNLK